MAIPGFCALLQSIIGILQTDPPVKSQKKKEKNITPSPSPVQITGNCPITLSPGLLNCSSSLLYEEQTHVFVSPCLSGSGMLPPEGLQFTFLKGISHGESCPSPDLPVCQNSPSQLCRPSAGRSLPLRAFKTASFELPQSPGQSYSFTSLSELSLSADFTYTSNYSLKPLTASLRGVSHVTKT